MNNRFVLVTGCSGAGKSTLVNALGTRGFSMLQEPGRRIVSEELAGTGNALPWVDLAKFSRRAFSIALADLVRAKTFNGYVFFDRGLVDAAVSLQFAGGEAYSSTLGGVRHYAKTVFVAPPWAEIFSQDEERRHGFGTAVAEFHRIQAALLDLGYDTCLLPKTTVDERAEFVMEILERG